MSELKVGDKVDYSSVVGMGLTSLDHVIKSIKLMPNNFGCDVAWVSGKSSCVDIEHLLLSDNR